MTSLTLVDCEPYRGRLTTAACVRRHELANGDPKGRTGRAREVQRARQSYRHCTGCEVGAARAAGEQVGEGHATQARGTAPAALEAPTPNSPASAPAPSAGPPAAKKENSVKTKTCKVVDCPNQFGAGKGNRKYCDEHRDPADRKGLEIEGKAKRAAAAALNSALGARSPAAKKRAGRKRAATPAAVEGIVSPKELLELAGFEVREVPTPAGTMLFIEDAA